MPMLRKAHTRTCAGKSMLDLVNFEACAKTKNRIIRPIIATAPNASVAKETRNLTNVTTIARIPATAIALRNDGLASLAALMKLAGERNSPASFVLGVSGSFIVITRFAWTDHFSISVGRAEPGDGRSEEHTSEL